VGGVDGSQAVFQSRALPADTNPMGSNAATELPDLDLDDELVHAEDLAETTGPESNPVVVLFFDLAGLPGWGSEAQPNDPDTSTILERYLGPLGAEIRLVRGSTAMAMAHDAHAAIAATIDLLGEAARSSGSATAGAHLTHDAIEDVGPASRAARAAAALAGLAEADRLLVTADVIGALTPADGSTLSFDTGTPADVDGVRLTTFVVRRR
jgi:hypothetical protein